MPLRGKEGMVGGDGGVGWMGVEARADEIGIKGEGG